MADSDDTGSGGTDRGGRSAGSPGPDGAALRGPLGPLTAPVRHRWPRPAEVAIVMSPLLWLLAAALQIRFEAHRLPEPFGGWWTSDGRFVSPGSPWDAVIWASALAAAGIVTNLRLFWLTPDRTQRRVAVFLVTGLVGILVAPSMVSVAVQAHDWRPPPVSAVLALAPIPAIAVAALMSRLVPAAGAWSRRPVLSDQAPRIPLAGTQRVAWTGGVNHRDRLLDLYLFVVVAAWAGLSLVGDAVLWEFSLDVGLVLYLLGEAVVTSLAQRLRVTVDARGLQVRCPVPWVRRWIPLESVVGAREVRVDAQAWSRGVIRTRQDGRTGLFVRSGPALEVLLTDGTMFAVTVDGAMEAAGALNALVDRRETPAATTAG